MSITQIIAGSHSLALVQLGVSYQHLSEVLNGWRTSQSLLGKISALPRQHL